jgi:starch synthase
MGGLRDIIIPHPDPKSTGFTFMRTEAEDFYRAIADAVALWENREEWHELMGRAMYQAFTWEKSGKHYAELYRQLETA